MIKIAIIGTGFGAAAHIPAFQSIEGVDVVAVASENLKKAKTVADKFGIPNPLSGFIEILDINLDAVSIALPPAVSGTAIRAAQRKNLHILAEKPLSGTLDETKEILFHKTDRIQMVNFQFPELKPFSLLRKMVQSGQYGMTRIVNIRWLVESYAERHHIMNWKRSRQQYGGVLNILGTHLIHYVEHIFGEIESLTAMCGIFPPREEPPEIAENTAIIVFKMKQGFLVNTCISNAAPFSRSHFIEVVCDKASIFLINETDDYMNGFSLELKSEQGHDIIYADTSLASGVDGRLSACQLITNKFVDSIIKRRQTIRPSFQDAYRTQKIAERIKASAAKEAEKGVDEA